MREHTFLLSYKAFLKQTVASFEEREYTWFFCGNAVFFLGMAMQLLLRHLVVYEITNTAASLAWMTVAAVVVLPFMAPIAGVYVARLNKRPILLFTEVSSTLLFLGIGILIVSGKIEFWHMLVTAPLFSIVFAFFMPARQALVPALVPKHKLANALALTMGSNTVTQMIGPAIVGLFIFLTDHGITMLIVAGMFGLASITDLRLPKHGMIGKQDSDQSESALRSFWTDLSALIGYLRNNQLIPLLLVFGMVLPLINFPLQQFMVVFAEKTFGDPGSKDFIAGLLISMLGVGSLIGALVSTNSDRFPHKGRLLMIGSFTAIIALGLFSISNHLWIAIIFLALMGFGQMLFQVTNNSSIQRIVENNMRGRVMSVVSLQWSLLPLGIIPLGFAIDRFGPGNSFGVTALFLFALLATMFFLTPRIRNLYMKPLKKIELSLVQAEKLVAEGKLTPDEAKKLTGENET